MDKKILKYASPTISGFKTGSLFKVYLNQYYNLDKLLIEYNTIFNSYGIYITKIYATNIYALIYIFRIKSLIKDLSNINTKEFLINNGYNYDNIETLILKLKNSFYEKKHTPHEVGLFLGYPVEDVIGFINNKGKNYKLNGCWKVYHNATKYKYIFDIYKKCRDNNLELYNKGYSLESLIYK